MGRAAQIPGWSRGFMEGKYADGLDRQRLWGGIRERNHLETDS